MHESHPVGRIGRFAARFRLANRRYDESVIRPGVDCGRIGHIAARPLLLGRRRSPVLVLEPSVVKEPSYDHDRLEHKVTERDLGRITQPHATTGDADVLRGWANPSYHVAHNRARFGTDYPATCDDW